MVSLVLVVVFVHKKFTLRIIFYSFLLCFSCLSEDLVAAMLYGLSKVVDAAEKKKRRSVIRI